MTSPTKTDLTGLVLAGGHSTRFGSDKALHRLDSETLVERAHKLLGKYLSEVYISCRQDQGIDKLGMSCIYDKFPSLGPISGIISAKDQIQTGLFVLAVDYIIPDFKIVDELLARRNPQKDATAYQHSDGTREPLCTVYELSAFPKMYARFAANKLSLSQLLQEIRVEIVTLSEAQTWINLNRLES